ncbi:HAD-IA family hydrolase [Streptomyces microflavus]|uniref:HAD-IA family hydrolase n=1 Tax=Streptomyces microflavus TaxID=1919 RepID=UPI00332706DA
MQFSEYYERSALMSDGQPGNPRYRAALFDLDGTLVASSNTIDRHTRMWAKRNDLDVAEVMQASHGLRDRDFVPMFVSRSRVEAEIRWLHELSCRDTAGIAASPGATALTRSLPTGVWAVVTSAAREVALCRLAAASLPQPSLLICSEHVAEGKPAPESYLRAAAALNIGPHDCLVFEDSIAGLLSAKSAGMAAIAVGWRQAPVHGTPVTDLREVRIDCSPQGRLQVSSPAVCQPRAAPFDTSTISTAPFSAKD